MHTPILPFHFRLVSLVRLPGAAGREVMNEAVLYHKDAQITACWTSRHVDIRCKTACKTFQISGVISVQKLPPWVV